jgi:hypothetical protein
MGTSAMSVARLEGTGWPVFRREGISKKEYTGNGNGAWQQKSCSPGRPASHWIHHDFYPSPAPRLSWALDEFYAAVSDEFGVDLGEADEAYLETPGAVIDFIVDGTTPTDGMVGEEYRDHVAGVIGEIMARTLGVTRYSETSRLVDLHVR